MLGVCIENLSKQYSVPGHSPIEAVRDLSLEVAKGELLVVVGPSGSGKTSLLRMIAGLEEISGGVVYIEGRPVNSDPPQDREVAMIFQEHVLYPHMTVQQNLGFGMKLRCCPPREREARVRDMAELLGLTLLLRRLPKAISGGERQRVALGRALVLAPKVLLLDEPLSNLDAPLRAELRREIRTLHRRFGTTMIYVTHDQQEAMCLADRIAVLKDGQLQQVGSPRQVYQNPANLFVGQFFGAGMNLVRGCICQDSSAFWFRQSEPSKLGGLNFPLEGTPGREWQRQVNRATIFGIRSEDLTPVNLAGQPAHAVRLDGVVEGVEFNGTETIIQLRTGLAVLAMRAPVDYTPSVGSSVAISFDVRKGHFFDEKVGNRLE